MVASAARDGAALTTGGGAAGADDLEVIVAYSRDHDRQIGAASFTCKLGGTTVLVHRVPDFNAPLQQRWLANSIAMLTGVKLT